MVAKYSGDNNFADAQGQTTVRLRGGFELEQPSKPSPELQQKAPSRRSSNDVAAPRTRAA
jgi:hypothetical protein